MSKPICLAFALLILTTILCDNSVFSKRGSWRKYDVCGCRFHNNGLQCKRKLNTKALKELSVVECICNNPQINLNKASRKMFWQMCSSNPQTPL